MCRHIDTLCEGSAVLMGSLEVTGEHIPRTPWVLGGETPTWLMMMRYD